MLKWHAIINHFVWRDYFLKLLANESGTVVEHSARYPKIKDSNPADSGREMLRLGKSNGQKKLLMTFIIV